MRPRLLRPLLILEFLLSLQVFFTCWSQIGGQYHLDLMFWPWKLGLSLAAACLVTAATSAVARADGPIPRRVWLYISLLVVAAGLAGAVTYYYHVNEPQDDDEEDAGPQITKTVWTPALSGINPRAAR